jgi:ribonuclease HI
MGQSSQADVLLVFDGGSLGNPGEGYGSFITRGLVDIPGKVDVRFGDRITNNEAEYMTLNQGLQRVLSELEANRRDPGSVTIEVRSDSQLVVEQVNGRWKVRNDRMRALHAATLNLLKRFGAWRVVWHPRVESVRLFGH